MQEDMIVIRDPKTFCFNFELLKDFDEHMKQQTEFIIKSNESLAKNKIRTRMLNIC